MKLPLALVSVALLAAACGGTAVATVPPTGLVSSTPSAGQTRSAGAGATPHAKVDVCALMPLGEVQSKSPFQAVLADSKPTVPAGGCQYLAALGTGVTLLLEVSGYELSVADAQTAFASHRQAAVDRGLPVSDITGLGDVAFAAGSDIVGVHALVGNLQLDANFHGEWPDTTDDAKVAAGTELVRTLLSRLST